VLVESSFQFGGDVHRIAVFDVAALKHVDQLPFPEQGERRRGRTITGEIGPGTLGGFNILAREYGEEAIRFCRVLQREPDCWT